MHRALRSVGWTSLATVVLAGTLQAQTFSFRPAAAKSAGAVAQGRAGTPSLTLYGGLATGDNSFDLGPALAASFNWNIADAPFNIRLDPYFAYHSRDEGPDASLWFLGATGNLELAFRAAGTTAEPYVFGGGGFFSGALASMGPGDDEFDDSDMKGAFGFGGGVRFSGFTLEARMHDIAEFTTLAFLVGFRLGGQ